MSYSILKKCLLFSSINEEHYPALLHCINASQKYLQTGEYVWMAEDEVSTVAVVLSGSVELIKENHAGIKHILDFVGPGQLFGEGIVCTRQRRSPVTVRARENTLILLIPLSRIIKTCEHSCSFHFQIIQNMMLLLGEKNRLLTRKIELLALKGMRQKLATYLLYEADQQRILSIGSSSQETENNPLTETRALDGKPLSNKQNSLPFTIIPNRNELAEYLNVSRSSMCRELGRMKQEGLIDYHQNTFRILSREKLIHALS